MAKKSGCGCLGVILAIGLVCGLFFTVVMGVFGWYALEFSQDPQAFLKNHEKAVRNMADVVLSQITAREPLGSEAFFDEEAYNQFAQKQGKLVEAMQKNQGKTLEWSEIYTSKELVSFLKADLAEYGITHYSIHFDKGKIFFSASVPGASLEPFYQSDWPEVAIKILRSVQWVNLEGTLQGDFQSNKLSLVCEDLLVGNLRASEFVLDEINRMLREHQTRVSEMIFQKMAQMNVKINTVVFESGQIRVSFVLNPKI